MSKAATMGPQSRFSIDFSLLILPIFLIIGIFNMHRKNTKASLLEQGERSVIVKSILHHAVFALFVRTL